MNVICFGDSITQAGDCAEGDRWPTVLQIALDDWRVGVYHVYNRGVNGNTTADGLARFAKDVLPLLPGVLIVEFGINDCNHAPWGRVPAVGVEEYRKNLREFHRVCRAQKSVCVLVANHPLSRARLAQGNGRTLHVNLQPYNEAVRQLAAELRAPLVDIPRMMEERAIKLADFVQEDGIHLTAQGN
ncbi:MAG: SGNH/GDSL hydrolase family protein, partial [candidate division KSB1 bacterium]|nr:SGNH/GDSL hydrolase family protein [candidate division KSB1 bacterium]